MVRNATGGRTVTVVRYIVRAGRLTSVIAALCKSEQVCQMNKSPTA